MNGPAVLLPIARARYVDGQRIKQALSDHLRGVAALAERFAAAFGAAGLGRVSPAPHGAGVD